MMTDAQFNVLLAELAEIKSIVQKLSPTSQTKITVLGNKAVSKSVKGMGLEDDFTFPTANSE